MVNQSLLVAQLTPQDSVFNVIQAEHVFADTVGHLAPEIGVILYQVHLGSGFLGRRGQQRLCLVQICQCIDG